MRKYLSIGVLCLVAACSSSRPAETPTSTTPPSAGTSQPASPRPESNAPPPTQPPTELVTSRTCADDRSREGVRAAELYFTNVSGESRSVSWIDYDGRPQLYKVLNDRETYVQQTFLTHPWQVADASGRCLGLYFAREIPTSVVLEPAAGAQSNLQARGCDQETVLQSGNSTAATAIEFVNESSGTVRVYWRNFSGQRVLYNTIAPGARYVQPTFVTHVWIVTDTADQCRAVFLPEATPARATVR